MQMIYMCIKCPFHLICHLTSLFKAYLDEMHSVFPDRGKNIVLIILHFVDEFSCVILKPIGKWQKKNNNNQKKAETLKNKRTSCRAYKANYILIARGDKVLLFCLTTPTTQK